MVEPGPVSPRLSRSWTVSDVFREEHECRLSEAGVMASDSRATANPSGCSGQCIETVPWSDSLVRSGMVNLGTWHDITRFSVSEI